MDKFKDFLTDQERKELRGFLNRRDFSGREHGRASAILHLDKGKSVPQVAEITFLDEQTVRNLVNRYRNGGIDGLLKDEYDGRSFKLTPEMRKELDVTLTRICTWTARESSCSVSRVSMPRRRWNS